MSLRKRQLIHREVKQNHASWSIHRALQRSLLLRLSKDKAACQASFEIALGLIRRAFPRHSDIQAPSNGDWTAIETYLPHALHLEWVYRYLEEGIITPLPTFTELLADVGNYMWERGLYEQGRKSLELAHRIYSSSNWGDLIEHSKVTSLLGGISLELGISGRKAGLEYTLRSLQLRQRHVDERERQRLPVSENDLLLLANSYNDMACCLLEYGAYEAVEEYLQRSLSLKRSLNLSEDGRAYFNYAENFKNLSMVRTAQDNHNEAIQLCVLAVSLIESGMGQTSAAAQSFRMHLGYAHYRAGNLESALSEQTQVREARLKIFGPKEIHTLNSFYACAVVLQSLGRLNDAE